MQAIQVHIEDAPKGIYLTKTIALDTKNPDGTLRFGRELIRPYKKVHTFYDTGEMTVKYYQKCEWDDDYNMFDSEEASKFYTPTSLSHHIFMDFLNAELDLDSIHNIAESILTGTHCTVKPEDISRASRQLLNSVIGWDRKTPFQCPSYKAVCSSYKDAETDETLYEVEFFES